MLYALLIVVVRLFLLMVRRRLSGFNGKEADLITPKKTEYP